MQNYQKTSVFGKEKIFGNCEAGGTNICKLTAEPFHLYESSKVAAYDTFSEKYDNTDLVGLYFEPCINDGTTSFTTNKAPGATTTTTVDTSKPQCSDKFDVYKLFVSHKLRLRYK